MTDTRAKSPKESEVVTRYLLMPEHTNPHGTAFGGLIMSWIDIVGSMAAQRHCGCNVVTASIDSMSFISPIFVGEHVILKAKVTYTGRTSIEVCVTVYKEIPMVEEETLATKAYLTFVAIDKEGKSVTVPQLRTESCEEIEEFRRAEERMKRRKEERKSLETGHTC